MGDLTREQIEARLRTLSSMGNVTVSTTRNDLAALYRMALRALAYERATGYDDPERLDFVLGRTGVDTHLDVLNRMRLDAEKARDEARAIDAGWQSMESAPRDGTRIMVALHGGYHKLASFERCEDYDRRLIEHFVCDGAGHSLDPLAWMPLPPPFTGDTNTLGGDDA